MVPLSKLPVRDRATYLEDLVLADDLFGQSLDAIQAKSWGLHQSKHSLGEYPHHSAWNESLPRNTFAPFLLPPERPHSNFLQEFSPRRCFVSFKQSPKQNISTCTNAPMKVPVLNHRNVLDVQWGFGVPEYHLMETGTIVGIWAEVLGPKSSPKLCCSTVDVLTEQGQSRTTVTAGSHGGTPKAHPVTVCLYLSPASHHRIWLWCSRFVVPQFEPILSVHMNCLFFFFRFDFYEVNGWLSCFVCASLLYPVHSEWF